MIRRDFIKSGGTLLAATPFMNFAAGKPLTKKMLVLGFDGMDPGIVKRLMGQGQLPNMQRLSGQGVFTMMRSSIPPQSPVAWGSFISGADPGVFGIFDFLHRNPENYTPMFSQTDTLPSRWLVNLGQYQIPLKPGKVVLKREGRAFWDYMEDRGIPATIVKLPTNYPPSASKQRTLAGMGTPDIRGTYGIYSLYTSDENESQSDLSAANIYYAYIDENNVMEGQIEGPVNDLIKEGENVVVPFKVYVDNRHKTARIDIQGQEILIAEKEYSDWVEIEFSLINHLAGITGMVRFYLMEMGDRFRLYISPTHLSPRAPAVPISTPSGYSRELTDHVGLFHTIGLPADTKALNNGTFSMENFITQSLSVFDESCRLFDYELQRFGGQKEGLLFFYFSSLDQGQHMFWALNDKEHPYYHPEESRKFAYITDEMYRKFDRVLGKAMKNIDPGIPLLLMSDHGFGPFRREVNINNWLVKEGYLKMSVDDGGGEEISILGYADWPASKAYALGLNGLYLNLKGREKEGAVGPEERRRLLDEIKAKLETISDPQNGNKVISCAYISEDNFSKNFIDRAPDIILGFDRGYRISDESALGTLSREMISDNMGWWSGDHCVDPKKVPASFISNFKIQNPVPDMQDVAPTILKYFGIATPAQMTGKALI
ncbi:MAG: alkaline phosphatase family protein [Candidatus Aminicenantes bacterium]|nr:alkaline phosphatase family protein [Acidobacteriota bacterium]MCG2813031.1 alkaline phosphatase family protein [Candidatus Aminicenantes bacterium]